MKNFLLIAAVASIVIVPAGARDWARDPAVIQIDDAAEIFAVGDAHSDFVRLERAMAGAGIVESVAGTGDAKWRAGRAVVVVTGDMIDKGPRALDVIRFLMRVRKEAKRAGGEVVILAGNHEAEFLADPAAPKGREFAAQLKAANLDPAAVGACKGEVGEFLCSLAFAARVGDWFFSHAGNSGGRTITQLQADLEAGVDRDGYRTKQLVGNDSVLEARLNGEGRKVWIDSGLPAKSERQLLDEYTKALGVAHIVEGHVPSEVTFADGVKRPRGTMFQRYGMLFLIDTGMSQGVGDSHGAVLDIKRADIKRAQGGETATAICPDGKATLLWDSRSNQDVGSAGPCL